MDANQAVVTMKIECEERRKQAAGAFSVVSTLQNADARQENCEDFF